VFGVFTVLAIVAGISISSWFQQKFNVDDIEKTQETIRERFGDPDAFTPSLDGALPSDRLQIFVALRESLAVPRDEAALGLARFVRKTKTKKAGDRGKISKVFDFIGMAGEGTDMASGLVTFYGHRQKLLLDAGMGDGEYAYWHALTALSFLEWDPLANPDVEAVLNEIDMSNDADELREELVRGFRRHLRNQRRALEAKATRTAAEEAALRRVAEELDRERPSGGAPFAGAFPADWAAVLEPYRGHLEAALPKEPAAVVLDLAVVDAEGSHFRFGSGKHRRPD